MPAGKIRNTHFKHLGILLALQFVLAFIAYRPFIAEPGQYLFSEAHDGIKNYFHFQHFVTDTTANAPFLMQYNTHYPFGEHAMFTDITPSIAIPLKFIHRHIVSMDSAAIYIKHWMIVVNPLICSFLLWFVLKPFIRSKPLLLFFCIAIPWLHPQILRVFPGTLNLAWTWLSLLPIAVLMAWYRDIRDHGVGGYKWVFVLFLIAFFAGLTHLYYPLITGLFTAGFVLGSLLIIYRQNSKIPFKSLLIAFSMVLAIVMAIVCLLLLLHFTDSYYQLRPETAGGYDWSEWNLSLEALFRSHNFLLIKSPFFQSQTIHYESHAYLGSFAIAGGILLLLYGAFQLFVKRNFTLRKQSISAIWLPLSLGALACFFTALGETFYFPRWDFTLYNVLNPLFYLHFVTDSVEHFRCLGRFVWPFSWVALISGAAIFSHFFDSFQNADVKNQKWMGYSIAAILLALMATDVASTIHRLNHFNYPNRLTAENTKLYWQDALQQIQPEHYQAILPLPYFHVGSENLEHTIDGIPQQKADMFALSLTSGLPLMAHQASRTPVIYTKAMFESLLNGSWTPELSARLKPKPILVVALEDWYEQPAHSKFTPAFEPAAHLFGNAEQMLQPFNPRLLHRQGGYLFYHIE